MPRYYFYRSNRFTKPALLMVEKDSFSVALPSDPHPVRCRGFVWRCYNRDIAVHLSQEEGQSMLATWQAEAKTAGPAPRCPLCGWPRSDSTLIDSSLNEFRCANCEHCFVSEE